MSAVALKFDELPAALREQLQARGEVHLRLIEGGAVEVRSARSIRELFGSVRTSRPISLEDIERGIEQGAVEDWRG